MNNIMIGVYDQPNLLDPRVEEMVQMWGARIGTLPGAGSEDLHNLKILISFMVREEREACAQLAASHFIPGHAVAGYAFAAALSRKIRERGEYPETNLKPSKRSSR